MSGPGPEHAYRPLDRRAKWAIGLLLVGILADAAGVISGLMQRSLLADIAAGDIVTKVEADSNDRRQLIVGSIQGGIFILTAVAFLFWFSRAYRNLEAVGAGKPRFRYGWAVGAWFVPFLNLWRPKQIANDIWRASDPDAPPAQESTSLPKLYWFWWLGFLVMGWLYSSGSRLMIRAEGASELKTATGVLLAGDVLSLLTGVLAVFVVRRTTARQTARAARLGVAAQEDPRPLWLRRSAWATLLATLAAFALQSLISVASWTGNLEPSGEAGTPRAPRTAPSDALFADDFSKEGVWLVQSDNALAADYTGGHYRIIVRETDSLWYSALPLPKDVDSMSVEVDAIFDVGRVKTDYYGLGCVASSQVNYLFGISPDGYHSISFIASGQQDVRRLVEKNAKRRFSAGHATNRLRAECGKEGDHTVLRLAVNGHQVAQTTHRGTGQFAGIEVFAYSGAGQTEVRFDDLVVREIASR